MSAIPLTPIPVELDDPVFSAIKMWSFEDEFVSRMLIDDIPQRIKYGNARIRAYVDPQKRVVGFGTLDVCEDFAIFSEGKPHLYIPLLAVNPDMRGRGHGKAIVNHLIDESASLVARDAAIHHALFLDVYEDNNVAIRLYSGCGFVKLNGGFVDAVNNKNFFIMSTHIKLILRSRKTTYDPEPPVTSHAGSCFIPSLSFSPINRSKALNAVLGRIGLSSISGIPLPWFERDKISVSGRWGRSLNVTQNRKVDSLGYRLPR